MTPHQGGGCGKSPQQSHQAAAVGHQAAVKVRIRTPLQRTSWRPSGMGPQQAKACAQRAANMPLPVLADKGVC